MSLGAFFSSMKKIKPPVQPTDIPPYAFAKIGLDLSGPYLTSLSGNKYIVGFIDWYSVWPESFAVPDKSANTIAHLIMEEIYPRFGSPLKIVSDNGSEVINRVVKETLQYLYIHHVTTSFISQRQTLALSASIVHCMTYKQRNYKTI